MFVKYDCGCIGIFRPCEKDVVVKCCDAGNEQGELAFILRDMKDKTFTKLSDMEEIEMIKHIDQMIAAGYAMREVRRLIAGQL